MNLDNCARRLGHFLMIGAFLLASGWKVSAQIRSLSDSSEISGAYSFNSSWFGAFLNSDDIHWVFSEILGWTYFQSPDKEASLWLYHGELDGWLWTEPAAFPYAYLAGEGWLYFYRDDFYSYYFSFNTGSWYALEKSWGSPFLNEEQQAARFLAQATLGADYELIRSVTATSPEAWINQQYDLPVTTLASIEERLFTEEDDELVDRIYMEFRSPWWESVISGNDPLRQRIALALSEIFVISDRGILEDHPQGVMNYYDMLLRHAFGNFRDLLYDVTIHPCMGNYLSHAGNRPPDPSTGRFPDENYAREVMQLFTIGLYELNMDGSRKLDEGGHPIPTYNNAHITEFARVFTGLNFDIRNELIDFEEDEEITNPPTIDSITFDEIAAFELFNFVEPMYFFEREHDTGPKTLLNGTTLPANRTIAQDLNGALDNLFFHPNTPPFISRLLIQRLVKSNPSPAYISRVASAFVDNGNGVRGDMKAVISAILLDIEARTPDVLEDPRCGKMRESFFKLVHFLRAFNASPSENAYHLWDEDYAEAFSMRPMSSPSVFNFYLPDYSPSGPVGDNALVGPEFQIANSFTLSSALNLLHETIVEDRIQLSEYDPDLAEEEGIPLRAEHFPRWRVDLSDEIALAGDLDALINRLDLILTYGQLSQDTKAIIIRGLQSLIEMGNSEPETIVRLAIYFIMSSPAYNILL